MRALREIFDRHRWKELHRKPPRSELGQSSSVHRRVFQGQAPSCSMAGTERPDLSPTTLV